MKMNYDKWFFDQYQYLTGNRKGKTSYNDTKWIEFVNRYKRLIDLSSTLPQDQPFGVMGNSYAFDQLIQLLSRSNYTFEDLNESLINTYKYSLKNCMGINNVNTHVVTFKTKNTDRKHVTSNGEWYIIDVPFDQMSFGGRDEFIRQRIHDIHTTENGRYIPFNEFISNDLDDILGFSFLCCVNGFICNDCQVAIDDKGFKFKIKWLYSSDVNFVIYKFDTCFVHDVVIDSTQLSSQLITIDQLDSLISKHGYGEYQCLLNIYDEDYKSSVPTVVNFGKLNKNGLSIVNLQNKTLDMITRNKSKSIHVVIYVLKYFHEVPNLYPAINYYDLIEMGKVYTERHEDVTDADHNKIIMSSSKYRNNLEICTPPISLDRSSTTSFKTIQSCLRMDTDLMALNNKVKGIGNALTKPMNASTVISDITIPLSDLLFKLKKQYIIYNAGCILTSLVPSRYVNEFGNFINVLNQMFNTANEVIQQEDPNYLEITKYDIPQLYGNNYESFVNKICEPFKNERLKTISQMKSLVSNFFVDDNSDRFNRPVSPYCFMVLRYDQQEDCWLFDTPTIKHFHGISNTFYIDSSLKGDEIFKFFVFYSDTANPSEKTVNVLNEENILDFDLFVTEVDKHMGFVKYWNVENKLLKYSKILFDKYDQDTCIQVLSKILKRKLVDNDLLYDYPSEIEYELSSINQLNYKDYDDDSEYAPFALNYLFYTLNMMNYDTDKLQSYFIHRLTDRRFNNRFVDIPLSKMIKSLDTTLVNYSHFSQYPTTINTSTCALPDESYNAFYGYGNIVSNSGYTVESNPYPYVYNIYNTNIQYPYIDENGVSNKDYYIQYDSLQEYGYEDYAYNVDITLSKYMSKYLTAVYSYISEFQTDYTTTFNKTSLCNIAIETVGSMINDINQYLIDHTPMIPSTQTIIESITTGNPFIEIMNQLKTLYNGCLYIQYQGSTISIYTIINDLLKDIRYTYYMFGFDNFALHTIRALYIHLKKINTPMNVYEFKRWISGIDYNLILRMKYMLAKNQYSTISQSTFERYADMIRTYVVQCHSLFDDITNTIDSLSDSLYTTHLEPIISHCLNVLNTYAFDMYCISNIEVTSVTQYPSRPYIVTATVNTSDSHFTIPNSSSTPTDCTLIFIPISEKVGNSYKITTMVGLCKYCVFNGAVMNSLTGVVKSKEGTQLGTLTFNMSFEKASNSSSLSNDIQLLNEFTNTKFDFQHVHETFELNTNDDIINSPRTPINYELYAGNHFKPLESLHELIKDTQSPLDRLYLPSIEINNLLIESLSNTGTYGVYFKPSQVLHLPKDSNNVITSVGGKYHPGQRLYLYTKDLGFVFPVIVTSIDSNEAHGFVECKVDSYNSKWFKVTDYSDIVNYFTNDIECEVIDDNISAFMDEFNNPSFVEYNIIDNTFDTESVDEYTLPGDPIYVTNHSPYVYTRLNYMFNETIPDRFIDDDHKLYSFTFIGSHNLYGENNTISINMITHNFQPLTKNQLYTDLRGEPNDHEVYKQERRVFSEYLDNVNTDIVVYKQECDEYIEEMQQAETELEYQEALLKYENASFDLSYSEDFANRLNTMIDEPESISKWYNVRSYNAAAVYMTNGRGRLNSTYIPNISYIQSVDDVNIYVYDWDNKYWISPEYYTINIETVDGVNFGNKSNYVTDLSAYKMSITFDNSLPRSKRLLVYIGYNKSDLFDDIQLHDKTCYVRFKPLITTNVSNVNPYDDIKIRKHFDGNETYVFDESNTPDNFSDGDCYRLIRYKHNGNYQYAPSIRMCDLTVTNSGTDYPYTDFDLYIPNPFKDTNTDKEFKQIQYAVDIIQPIDNFNSDETVKLICISNNDKSSYNGLLSSVLFEGTTTSNSITINESSLGYVDEGHYICTVIPSSGSSCVGGLIDIEVSYTSTPIVDTLGAWIKVPDELSAYREIPRDFIIKAKSNSFDYTKQSTVVFNTKYTKYITDTINDTNDYSVNNPFEYYHDTKNDIRLPISDTRHNDASKRFVVDTSQNPDVKIIKTTYISVCRYSLNDIPSDGVIDVTGYIPTPLSRDRYEFYVNGRIISGNNITILSPTSFQLMNLKSLKNFELIELVDDKYNSSAFIRNNIYVSANGKMFGSYHEMMLSNDEVIDQNIRFIFNTDQQSELYKYNINKNPNNENIEPDVLDGLTYTQQSTIPWNELYNLPSINGIQINNLTTKDFGFVEIQDNEVLNMFNKVWKREILTNPDFPTNHCLDKQRSMVQLHTANVTDVFPDIQNPEDWLCVYASGNMNRYFTMYVSNTENGEIDDVDNTLKIIPFVKTGMYILIPSTFREKWLHATTTISVNPKPIKL